MWSFLVQRFRFSALLMMAVTIMGLASLSLLPREASPEVKVPYASVLTLYPGASPVDIEELITEPLEDGILSLEDLKNVESFSSEGVSSIFVEFETDVDIQDKVRELQDAVNSVEGDLPDDVFDPVVTELNFDNAPILVISLSADLPHTELVSIAEEVESSILEVKGVSDVDLLGVREEEVTIEVDPVKMEQYGVSILNVIQILQASESNTPLGTVESNDTQYTLRLHSELSVDELEDFILYTVNNEAIYLRDLADIKRGLSEISTDSRVSLEGSEPESAISLNVYKKTGGDIIAIVDEINAKIDAMKTDTLDGIVIFTAVDGATDIRDQLGELSLSGLQTIVLVALVLFLSLGVREAFVAGLAIPLTFLITFTGLTLIGTTLNFLSLFSLILALGILVDTGVVITEGMHVRLQKGDSPKQVAMDTVQEYKWPLISGTLTTVAAFVPMLLMTGIIGEFVKHIPRTVVITLMASLFVGLGFLPVIGSRILKVHHEKKKRWLERKIEALKESYRHVLQWLLRYKERQVMLIVSMVLCFFASLALPITGILQVTMFPQTDYRTFFIEAELPKGSLLEETDRVVQQVEAVLLETPEVESFVVTIGSSTSNTDGLGGAGLSSANLASFTVNLYEDRERSSLEIIEIYREAFQAVDGGEVNVIGVSDGPPAAPPIEFKISGPELEELKAYANDALSVLESTEGVINASSSLSDTTSEFVLTIDRQKAALAGLNPVTLAQMARVSIDGLDVLTLKEDGKEIDVILKSSADASLQDILALPITTNTDSQSLDTFVDLSFEPAPTSILHIDGDRIVRVTADLESGYFPNVVLADFQENYEADLAPDYQLEYGGEADETAESFASLGRAMLIGMLLIIVILILQFNSFRQAALILFTIPLALIGVFVGLSLLGLPFSFPAFVGVVALAGIVVNNAIILIDRINKNIAEGHDISVAILDAGASRFQPILLTSITTIIGILPLALSDPTWGPLGFTIISGLIFSTGLTLIAIPSSYKLLH